MSESKISPTFEYLVDNPKGAMTSIKYVTLRPGRKTRVKVPMFATEVRFAPKIFAEALTKSGKKLYEWLPMIGKQTCMDLTEKVCFIRLKHNSTKAPREIVLKFRIEL